MPTPAALPAGSRLLHIGPHKTGTSALQAAFDQAREDMASQGVHYVSRGRHDARAARWITGRLVAGADPAHAERAWQGVRERLHDHTADRRVFSSEFLSDATDEQAARIVREIDHEDLWVAITLRPLARILPSQYQQGLQRQGTRRYDDWLHSVLDEHPTTPTPTQFWLRHRHDVLVRRWADQVGPDRMVVVVLDPRDHAFLPRSFEELLGLRPDTLAGTDAQENRSLTAAEAELLRRFNEQFGELGLPPDHYVRVMRRLKDHVKARVPGPQEPRLATPDWAVERANEIGREMADGIAALGVMVHGHLDSIGTASLSGLESTPEPPATIDVDVAAWFGAGVAAGAHVLAAPKAPSEASATTPSEAAAPRTRRRRWTR